MKVYNKQECLLLVGLFRLVLRLRVRPQAYPRVGAPVPTFIELLLRKLILS
jgi:hypothetical protein